jgi:hypothetical protein
VLLPHGLLWLPTALLGLSGLLVWLPTALLGLSGLLVWLPTALLGLSGLLVWLPTALLGLLLCEGRLLDRLLARWTTTLLGSLSRDGWCGRGWRPKACDCLPAAPRLTCAAVAAVGHGGSRRHVGGDGVLSASVGGLPMSPIYTGHWWLR